MDNAWNELTGPLSETVGQENLRLGEKVHLLDPGVDPHNLDADVLVTPEDAETVARIVAFCSENDIPIVPHGGRTGLAEGAVSEPGQIVLSTAKLNRIISLDPMGGTITVEAGVRLAEAEAAAAEHGLTVGIDLNARDSATIGGMISTNAGGIEAFRNGVMRQRILGLEAVMPDGTLFSELKRVSKANEGYDIKQLLIGAEGTLGIVTKAVLELLPAPKGRATALVACDDTQSAVRLFRLFRNADGGELLSCEIMWAGYAHATAAILGAEATLAFHDDPNAVFVLIEVADPDQQSGQAFLEQMLGEALELGAATNAVIAKNETERRAFWLIREDSFALNNAHPYAAWYDVSVPHDQLPAYEQRLTARAQEIDPKLEIYMMGHLGDGNLHLSLSAGEPRDDLKDAIAEAVQNGLAEVGGSFSAEHGIGLSKRDDLGRYAVPGKLQMMRAIKSALDPKNIMNPGKIV